MRPQREHIPAAGIKSRRIQIVPRKKRFIASLGGRLPYAAFLTRLLSGVILWGYYLRLFSGIIFWGYYLRLFSGVTIWGYFLGLSSGAILHRPSPFPRVPALQTPFFSQISFRQHRSQKGFVLAVQTSLP